MHFSSIVLPLVALAGQASAHMIMGFPVPYGKSTLNNSPLAANGADFPCKFRGADTYNAEGASNVFAGGSTQKLSFIGSAVHGGGSCQLSVTTDNPPSAHSTWKVIHSIEGGCPTDTTGNLPADPSGNGASVFQWTVPEALAGGNYTLAWTWFNRIGNREMYMNCAPLTVTSGSSSKIRARDVELQKRDTQAFLSTLPQMFVANIGNGCGTLETSSVKFPDPGTSLQLISGSQGGFAPPSGTCANDAPSSGGAAAAAPSSGSSSSGSAAGSAGDAPAVASTSAISNPGGVFVPLSTSTIMVIPTPAASSAVPAAVVPASSSAAPVAAASAAPAQSASNGAEVQGSACSPEGTWNCLPDGKTYQQCGSGIWTPVMPLAAGTACSPGRGALRMVVPSRARRTRNRLA